MAIENNDNCFVCGMKNPFGFQVKPEIIDGGHLFALNVRPMNIYKVGQIFYTAASSARY